MALTTFGGLDPFAMMDPMFFDVSSMGLGGGLGGWDTGLGTATTGRRRAVMPADVMETPNEFVMMMDVPGVKQEDINLELDGYVVRVSADYKVPNEYSGDDIKWHRAGRPFGVHTRSLRFPESCDMSKIDAKFQNGSLCVKIAKKSEAKTHRIQIGGAQGAQAIEAGAA